MKGMCFSPSNRNCKGFSTVWGQFIPEKMRSNRLIEYVLLMSKNHWTVLKEPFLASHLHLLISNCFLPHPSAYSGLSTHSHPCHVIFFYILLRLAPYRKDSLWGTPAEQGYSKEQETNTSKLLPILNNHHQNITLQRMEKASVFLEISLWNAAIITRPRWAILCFCPRTRSISSNRASKQQS